MNTNSGFSELAQAYLQHVNAIQAGREALKVDIVKVLTEVVRRWKLEEGQEGEVGEDGLEIPLLAEDSRLAIDLCMTWDAIHSPLPTVNGVVRPADDSEPSLSKLFDLRPLASPTMPPVDSTLLLQNPVEACFSVLRQAAAEFNKIARCGHAQRRLLGWEMLSEFSLRFKDCSQGIPIGWDTKRGELEDEGDDWPCHFQWSSKVHKGWHWWVNYDPRASHLGDPAQLSLQVNLQDRNVPYFAESENVQTGSRILMVHNWQREFELVFAGQASFTDVVNQMIQTALKIYQLNERPTVK